MAWGKFAHVLAKRFQSFHLRSHHQFAFRGVAVVKRNDANRVTTDEPLVLLNIVQDEGKHAFQMMGECCSVLPVQSQNHFAIAARLVGVCPCFSAQLLVVVNLSVHGQSGPGLFVDEGLGTATYVYNGQPLVRENGTLVLEYTGPVRAAMSLAFRNGQRCRTQVVSR